MVILVIGVVAAIAIPVFLGQRQKGYDAEAKNDLRNLANFEEIYLKDTGSYGTMAAVAVKESPPTISRGRAQRGALRRRQRLLPLRHAWCHRCDLLLRQRSRRHAALWSVLLPGHDVRDQWRHPCRMMRRRTRPAPEPMSRITTGLPMVCRAAIRGAQCEQSQRVVPRALWALTATRVLLLSSCSSPCCSSAWS